MGFAIILSSSLAVPPQCLSRIHSNTSSTFVHQPKTVLGLCIIIFCCSAVPLKCLDQILLCTLPIRIHPGKIRLRLHIIMFCCSVVPLKGLGKILLCPLPALIPLGNIPLGVDITLLGGEHIILKRNPFQFFPGFFNIRLPVFSLLNHGTGHRSKRTLRCLQLALKLIKPVIESLHFGPDISTLPLDKSI